MEDAVFIAIKKEIRNPLNRVKRKKEDSQREETYQRKVGETTWV